MARNMRVTFLGTSSGGGPSTSRNCSSLVVDVVGDGSLWMVDCAEGTTRQFHTQPRGNGEGALRAPKVTKLFVTHMHADHVMGIIPFLRHILYPPRVADGSEVLPPTKPPPRIDIYGPAGLRIFIRSILTMTLTKTADTYAVHELLTPDCPRTPCDAASLHSSECPGSDILCGEQRFWRGITGSRGQLGDIIVDAGLISHRGDSDLTSKLDPCIGYIFREPLFPNRKLAILGDTYDASSIMPLLSSPPPSLLVHEATDAYIPTSVDPQARRKNDEVQEKVLSRGHSTPVMAGEFAKRVGAERLVLNHIGSRFPAPRQWKNSHDVRSAVIDEISRQASQAWGIGYAQVAFDFMRVNILAPSVPTTQVNEVVGILLEAVSGSGDQVSVSGFEETAVSGQRGDDGGGGGRGNGDWRGRRGRGRGRGNPGWRSQDYRGGQNGRNKKRTRVGDT